MELWQVRVSFLDVVNFDVAENVKYQLLLSMVNGNPFSYRSIFL